jgi:hypothetical protein
MKFQQEPLFYAEIRQEGYHIYNLENAETPNYYPDELQDYPGVSMRELREGDIITIRVYFGVGSGNEMQVDSGYVDLRVEHVDLDRVMAVIVSELPDEYALSLGDSIDVFEEEILCKNEIQ